MLFYDLSSSLITLNLIRNIYLEERILRREREIELVDLRQDNFDEVLLPVHQNIAFAYPGGGNVRNLTDRIERKNKFCKFLGYSLRIFYFALFFNGNIVLWLEDARCSRKNSPAYWWLCFGYVVMGYLSLSVWIFLIIAICFCLPIVIICYLCILRRRTNTPATREFLEKLAVIEYNENEMLFSNKECCICMNDYSSNEKIIILPCNDKHNFHEDCIKTWLLLNAVCPICRRDFVDRNNSDYSFDDN